MRNLLGLCLVTLVCSSSASAQAVVGYGAITGAIMDPYGDGLPDTVVTLSNSSLGIQRSMTTTDDGMFNAPALPPGPGYVIRAKHNGYSELVLPDREVTTGETMNLKVELPVLPPDARVQPAPIVTIRYAKFGVYTVVNAEQINTLPTDDRRLEELVAMTPAVTEAPDGVIAFHGEGFTNAYLEDGLLAQGLYFYRQRGISPFTTQDAVLELQTVAQSAPSEFGHSANGFANAAAHLGTPAYHGAAYGYYNNQDFNASNRFDSGFHPTTKLEQYGLSAGGPTPILSRLYWFFNGEVTQGSSEGINLINNPMIGNAAGTAVQPSNCTVSTIAATAAQCTAAIGFINSQLNRVVPTSLHSDTGFAKIDYRLNRSNAFSIEGNAIHAHSPNGSVNEQVATNGELLGYNGTYTDEGRFAKAGYTASPAGNAINEIRAGWYHDRFSDYENKSLLPSTGTLGIEVAGTQIGANPNYPEVISEKRWEFLDNLTVSSSRHLLKFGAEYSRNQYKTAQIYASGADYVFPSLTTFAEDYSGNTLQHRDYNFLYQGFGQPVVTINHQGLMAYAQDIWRPLPRLTLNGGVHWEKVLLPPAPYTSTNFYETGSVASTSTDFSPRAGIAYQVFDHTTVRLGFGSYYQPYSGQALEALYTGNGINQANLELPPGLAGNLAFPKIYSPTLVATSFATGSQVIVYANNKFRNPYTEQANLSIEHNLGRNTLITVSVMQTRGVRLWTQADQNINDYSTTKVYTIDGANGQPTGNYYFSSMFTAKGGTNFAQVYSFDNYGYSRYNAAVVQIHRNLWHGLNVQAAYTWSHAIDNVSGPPVVGGVAAATLIPGDYRDDQGDSSFDQRQKGVINFTWAPTVSSNASPIAKYLINGWQLSGIFTYATGLPQTPLVEVIGQQFASGSNNGSTSITTAYVNSLNGSGGWNRVPFEDVNSLRAGSQSVLDLRIAKVIAFTDRIKGTLMFEAFNALNDQYTTSVNTIAYTATQGVLTPVPGVGQGNSAYGYPFGTNARRAQIAFRIVF